MPHDESADAQVREDLVAANHILVRLGVLDAFGHVSARVPGAPGTFLLSRNLAPGSVTVDDLVVHDLGGQGADERALYLERFIHSEIYKHRPDVMAVVHSHSPSVIPFGLSRVPLQPVIHMAGFLSTDGTPVYEIRDHAGDGTDLLITSPELGASLAGSLGDGNASLMRGHGSVSAGSSIAEVVYRAVYTEVNASIQLSARGLGEIRALTRAEADKANETVSKQIARAWNVWRLDVGSLTLGPERD